MSPDLSLNTKKCLHANNAMTSQSEVLLSNCLSGGEVMVRSQQDLRLKLSVC